MTTRTEQGLIALKDVLDRAFGPKGFPTVNRNEALEDILGGFGSLPQDGGGYVNLVDGQGDVVETTIGAAITQEISGYEIEHTAGLELFVCIGDQLKRDATMDAMMEAAAEAIEADRTLGGVVNWMQFEAPARENYKEDGLPIIKAVTFSVVMTFTSSRPF